MYVHIFSNTAILDRCIGQQKANRSVNRGFSASWDFQLGLNAYPHVRWAKEGNRGNGMLMNLLPFLPQGPDRTLISAPYLWLWLVILWIKSRANRAGIEEMVSFGAAQSSSSVTIWISVCVYSCRISHILEPLPAFWVTQRKLDFCCSKE